MEIIFREEPKIFNYVEIKDELSKNIEIKDLEHVTPLGNEQEQETIERALKNISYISTKKYSSKNDYTEAFIIAMVNGKEKYFTALFTTDDMYMVYDNATSANVGSLRKICNSRVIFRQPARYGTTG